MLMLALLVCVAARAEYYYYTDEPENDNYNYYKYTDVIISASTKPSAYQDEETETQKPEQTGFTPRTINPEELADVKDALKMLFKDRDVNLFASTTDEYADRETDDVTSWQTDAGEQLHKNALLDIIAQLDKNETSTKAVPSNFDNEKLKRADTDASIMDPQWITVDLWSAAENNTFDDSLESTPTTTEDLYDQNESENITITAKSSDIKNLWHKVIFYEDTLSESWVTKLKPVQENTRKQILYQPPTNTPDDSELRHDNNDDISDATDKSKDRLLHNNASVTRTSVMAVNSENLVLAQDETVVDFVTATMEEVVDNGTMVRIGSTNDASKSLEGEVQNETSLILYKGVRKGGADDRNMLLKARRLEDPTTSTTTTTTTTISTPSTKSRRRKTKTTKKKRRKTTRIFTYSTTTVKSRRKKTRYRVSTTTSITTKRTSTAVLLDIPRLMELIAKLTMEYSVNLTDMVNKTLQGVANFTCPVPTTTTRAPTTTTIPTPTTVTTTTVTTTTGDPFGNLTGTIMAKCFVCGLDETAMPREARCADAFAGDFIPLVPVEATARRMLASYRKYCRWMNVPKYFINETDPRSMWGRWTGGCSVRWIDISGIYTQRTCRNRHRAVMGNHWVSKRMAKLEMALQRMDVGCIISPMASLVPLSRGVSLYARFHVCVCTGSWCNRASPSPPSILNLIITPLFILLFIL